MQVAIAAGHDPVDGRLTRSGTHRNTLWLSPEQVVGACPRSCGLRGKIQQRQPAGERPSLRNAAADDKYKVTDDGDMKARCKPAEKRA
jgi:hypothetical protein